jgi:hypothetical protein
MAERWEDARHDEEADRRDRQDRVDRAMEKASLPNCGLCDDTGRGDNPDGSCEACAQSIEHLDTFEPTLFGTAVRLKTLKEEHTNEAGIGDEEKVAENRAWVAAQMRAAGIDYDDVQAVAYGTAIELAGAMLAEFRRRGSISEADIEAFLTGRIADTWIDAALTTAVHLKDARG